MRFQFLRNQQNLDNIAVGQELFIYRHLFVLRSQHSRFKRVLFLSKLYCDMLFFSFLKISQGLSNGLQNYQL